MVSTSLAAIIASICATSGAIFGVFATSLVNRHLDTRKREREERDVVGKYRDALLQASEELHTPLRYLCDGDIPLKQNPIALDSKNAQDSYKYCRLIYLIGRLFSWAYIIQNDIRTVHFSPTAQDHKIMTILYQISITLDEDAEVGLQDGNKYPVPFQVYKGFQAAIGEKMSLESGGKISCMGYATFWSQWTSLATPASPPVDQMPFRGWFKQIEDGIENLRSDTPFNDRDRRVSRIQKFQHLVVDLSEAIDPRNERIHSHERTRWAPAAGNVAGNAVGNAAGNAAANAVANAAGNPGGNDKKIGSLLAFCGRFNFFAADPEVPRLTSYKPRFK